MNIAKLKISNFRSFGPNETIVTFNKMSVCIGSNSTGKTTALLALVKLFGAYARDRELARSDFHITPGQNPDEIGEANLYIEAVIEFDELQSPGQDGAAGIPPFFNQMIINAPGQSPYVRIRLTATWKRGTTPEGDVDPRLDFITVAEGEQLDENTMVPVRPHQRSLIQTFYIPAMRDPRAQLRNDSGTLLYRLFNTIKWSPDLPENLKERGEEVNELFLSEPGVQTVESIIKRQWKEFHDDLRYSEAGLGFASTELQRVLKRVEVYFNPTFEEKEYTVDQLGDGLRSLFYIALVSTVLKLEADYLTMSEEAGLEIDPSSIPVLTIVALEEPENHLSPHLLGRVINLLEKLSIQSNSQVIISSHTPSVLQRVDPEVIRYFRIQPDTRQTCVKQIVLPLTTSNAYKYIKEAVRAYPELYFARIVVLGEGDSEELILAKVLQTADIHIDRSFLSIVPLGGRHVNHFWRLLNQLDIPHLTILDLDRERDGGGWGRIKYAFKQLLEIGVPQTDLLNVQMRDGTQLTLTLDDLEIMHNRELDFADLAMMEEFILWLRKFGVFFSTPLDIDFMMLKSFPDIYKNATEGTGPRIPERTNVTAFNERVVTATAATLKDEGGDGVTYTAEDKELFIWYNYLFLGRGKPITHLLALKELEGQEFLDNLPEPITALVEDVLAKLQEGQEQDGNTD